MYFSTRFDRKMSSHCTVDSVYNQSNNAREIARRNFLTFMIDVFDFDAKK